MKLSPRSTIKKIFSLGGSLSGLPLRVNIPKKGKLCVHGLSPWSTWFLIIHSCSPPGDGVIINDRVMIHPTIAPGRNLQDFSYASSRLNSPRVFLYSIFFTSHGDIR